MSQLPAAHDSDIVLLTVPADGAYLGVLRTAAAGLAARLQFTLDEIEDLRIAVDEACAMLLRLAAPTAALSCRFALRQDELGVEVAVPAAAAASPPATSSFAWKVLTALASAASASVADETAIIALTARRTGAPGAPAEPEPEPPEVPEPPEAPEPPGGPLSPTSR